MKGLQGYSSPAPDGKGVVIDADAMLVDLITVLKAFGIGKAEFVEKCGGRWDEVEVRITIPDSDKN